jgi:hypothetical protein
MFGDQTGIYQILSKEGIVEPQACQCGLLNRRLMFTILQLESICLDTFLRFIADPRQKSCSHMNIYDESKIEIRGVLSGDEATLYTTALPGLNGASLIWPQR